MQLYDLMGRSNTRNLPGRLLLIIPTNLAHKIPQEFWEQASLVAAEHPPIPLPELIDSTCRPRPTRWSVLKDRRGALPAELSLGEELRERLISHINFE